MSDVFLSYASQDRARVAPLVEAIERQGWTVWWDRRIDTGAYYDREIETALDEAACVIVIWSERSVASDWVRNEASEALRRGVLLPVAFDKVRPPLAFRLTQTLDLSASPEMLEALFTAIRRLCPEPGGADRPPAPAAVGVAKPAAAQTLHRAGFSRPGTWMAATVGLLLLLMAAGAWWVLRPAPAVAHSMTVRMAGFQLLSPDLPARMHDTVSSEIIAAFNADGAVGVSTASAPPAGTAPAYALGGTIHRDGDSIRVITRLTNERTSAILWSDSVDYAADQVSKVPRKIAVDAGTVIRCGLFGVSTYHKPLPDAVLSNYMQYCQEYWAYGGSKTLRFAQLVVAAAPDFSWGWSAVGNGFLQVSNEEQDSRRADEMRAAGRQAEDKALALDRNNSEALAHKAHLLDRHDWVSQEILFKKAIAAKPLDCGCEHYGYGEKLKSVGRLGEAIEQFRAATDMLALWPDSQLALADTLVAADRVADAKPHFDAAIDLSKDPNLDRWLAATNGVETGDYAAAITALRDPRLQMREGVRAALLSGYQALASREPEAKAKAVQALLALPRGEQDDVVATLLAALGANREALQVAGHHPSLFWRRSMRGVLSDPGFPAVAEQLGLLTYWKTSHTKPDVCLTKDQPAFCRSL